MMRKESGHQTPQTERELTETEESSEIWGRSRQLKERVIKWIGYSKREKSMERTWGRYSY